MSTPDRIASRHEFEVRIRIRVERDVRKISMEGWTRDLSESGVSAFIAQSLFPGESVILEIPLTEREKQEIPAKVIRSRGTEYGLQFMALSSEQRRLIRTVVNGQPVIPYHGSGR